MIATRMVFAHPEGTFGDRAQGEPFIVPIAIPLIAGPSALATVMLLFTTLTRLAGDRLQRWTGDAAMQAAGRLVGLVLTALAIELLLGGIRAFVEGLR